VILTTEPTRIDVAGVKTSVLDVISALSVPTPTRATLGNVSRIHVRNILKDWNFDLPVWGETVAETIAVRALYLVIFKDSLVAWLLKTANTDNFSCLYFVQSRLGV
jgi:hypothetical protein